MRQMNGQIPPSHGQGESGRGGGNQPAVFPSSWAGGHVQNPGRAAAGAPPMPSPDQFARLPPLSSLQPAAAAAVAAVTAAASSPFEQPPHPPAGAAAAGAAAAAAPASGRSNGAGASGVGGGRVSGGQVEVIEVCILVLCVWGGGKWVMYVE